MKKILLLVAILLCIAGAAGYWYWKQKQAAADATASAVETAEVKRGPLRQSVASTGKVEPNLDVEIKCKASGQVVSMPFDVSDVVKKGDLLMELDPIDQARAVQQAEAAVASSRAKVAQAKAALVVAETTLNSEKTKSQAGVRSSSARAKDAQSKAQREKDLLVKKQTTVEEAETAETAASQAVQDQQTAEAAVEATKALEQQLEVRRQDIALAQAELDADQIALDLANQRLTETKVVAPMDGVVSSRTAEVGQIIASGVSNVGGGTTVMTLSDMSSIFVLASVDESDIGGIKLGQRSDITADSFPRTHFAGKVARIATKGVNTSNVVTFEVKIEITSDNKKLLKPEMTTNVEIIIAEQESALSVPTQAIVRKEHKLYVTRRNPNTQEDEQVEVQTGISTGTDVEIVSGLAEGDTVVYKKEAESRWNAGGGMPKPPTSMMMMRPPGGGGRR